jgi:transcriptional regulator with XRE-family HTH domain
MDVGDRLREAREHLGMTQAELAAKLGVHVATVTLWENRKNRRKVATKYIQKIAKVLNIRVSELLGEGAEQTIPEPPPTLTTRDTPSISCCGCSG